MKMADTDVAAIQLLKRAVELDTSKRYTEALPCYQEGLDLLLQFIKVYNMPCHSMYAVRTRIIFLIK